MSVSLVTQFWVAECAKIYTPQRQRWLNSIARSKLVTWQFFSKTSIFLPPSSCQQTSKHGKLIAATMFEQNEIWLSLFVFQKKILSCEMKWKDNLKKNIYLFSQTKNNLQQTPTKSPPNPCNRTHNEQKIPKIFHKFQRFQQRILNIANQIFIPC